MEVGHALSCELSHDKCDSKRETFILNVDIFIKFLVFFLFPVCAYFVVVLYPEECYIYIPFSGRLERVSVIRFILTFNLAC